MKLRPVLAALATTALFSALLAQTPAAPAAASPIPAPRVRLSPHETISLKLDGQLVTVTYGRPYTKSPKTGEVRKIWGGLVKWDSADRLGADEATTFLTQSPLLIQGTTVPAGAYTLYIIASETAPKLAFSTAIAKWGVPVDESKDLARFSLEKSSLAQSVDQLTMAVEKGAAAGSGVLRIQWETTQFALPFTLKK